MTSVRESGQSQPAQVPRRDMGARTGDVCASPLPRCCRRGIVIAAAVTERSWTEVYVMLSFLVGLKFSLRAVRDRGRCDRPAKRVDAVAVLLDLGLERVDDPLPTPRALHRDTGVTGGDQAPDGLGIH